MKPTFRYNKYGIKDSFDQYRNIGGVFFEFYSADQSTFAAIIEEAKRLGLKTRIIKHELYREKKLK